MDGWRVMIVPLMPGKADFGEVTGYDHDRGVVSVVLDGEESPKRYHWDEVRPA